MFGIPAALPVVSSAAPGLGTLIGATVGGNLLGNLLNNRANRQISKEQMSFQKYMSDTAHTREVADLQRAGLSPTLSAGGAGASTPGGAGIPMQAPQIDIPSILQVATLEQNQQKIDIEKANSAAQITKGLTDQELTKMKTILSQKGMPRAHLEGAASDLISKWLQKAKQKVTNPQKSFNELFK